MIGISLSARSERQSDRPSSPGNIKSSRMRSMLRIGQHLAHGLAVGGGADAKAFLGERARHQVAHLAMVVDDQDVRTVVHALQFSSDRAGLGQKNCNDFWRKARSDTLGHKIVPAPTNLSDRSRS